MSRSLPFAIAGLLACTIAGRAHALEPSKGVYRIPFANGTDVHVGNDHIDHSPPGRIDMNGTGGGTYRIVAAADGIVRKVVDGFDKRLDCKGKPVSEQKNNYVWIEHANGEWTKYTHMQKGSSSGKAGLHEGQFVKAGTYLGDQGDVGCASGPHLHFEVGVPKDANGFTETGGFLTDNDGSKRNRIPRVCGIAGSRYVTDGKYKAREVPGAVSPGSREYARHGVPARDYQCLVDQAAMAGYAPEWLDAFSADGGVRFNVVFRPAGGVAWQAVHGLTSAQYQQRFDQFTHDGYRPTLVESYRDDGDTRYAAIFRKTGGPAFRAYHGVSATVHQQRMDQWSAEGYRPRTMAVTASGDQPRYTVVYEKAGGGQWLAKSRLTPDEYQHLFDSESAAGRLPVYLNAYGLDGRIYYSAIFSASPSGPAKARHGLTGAQYQNEWESATGSGYLTRVVTGYAVGGQPRYAAVWRK